MGNESIFIEKITFKKTIRSKRYSNYYGFVKSRVAARTPQLGNSRSESCHFVRKGGPKGVFLKTMKIENGSKNKFVITVRHLDPLKSVLGSGFAKNNKNQ